MQSPILEAPLLLRLKAVKWLSIYGFWFLLGVAGANLSRLIPSGWILYWVLLLGISGYFMFAPGTEEGKQNRSLTGFAFLLSCVAFWDLVISVFSLPIHVLTWILSAWQCIAILIIGLLLVGVFIGLLK